MRVGPLLAIVVLAVIFLSYLGQVFMWIVAGISVLALFILIFFTIKADRFSGPKILYDDLRDRMSGTENDNVIIIEQPDDKVVSTRNDKDEPR